MAITKKVLFGSIHCPDCPPAKQLLEENNIRFHYIDITENMANLKKFLALRDKLPVFDQFKEIGSIGIPVLVLNDGEELIFNLEEYDISKLKSSSTT